MSADNKDFTPMMARGTLVYLGRSGGFDVRDCPESEALASFIVASCNAAAIVPPVAAGSMDTEGLNKALQGMQTADGAGYAGILAWGVQQREQGRCEMFAEVEEENAILATKVEKAEAELGTLKESLRLVNEDHRLWVTRTHAAEDARDDALARVKELERVSQSLLEDHQRVEPHHQDGCKLCQSAIQCHGKPLPR